MNGWNFNRICLLVMMLEVLVTMVVIPVGLVRLCVQWLAREVLTEAFQVRWRCHMMLKMISSVFSEVMYVAFGLRLHLKDQIARLSIRIIRVEDARIRLKSSTSLMPSTRIESVKIVAPVEFELI